MFECINDLLIFFKSYSYKHGFPGEDDSEADELEYEDEFDGGASNSFFPVPTFIRCHAASNPLNNKSLNCTSFIADSDFNSE